MELRPTRIELIDRINTERERRSLSIRQTARLAGVPTATAQGWLSGRHFPTPALRPKFLNLVAELGLTGDLHSALWLTGAAHGAEPPGVE